MPKITFDLSQDLFDRLQELAKEKGRTPENSLEELLIDPIHRNHFLECAAPRDYFEGRPAVSAAEANEAQHLVESRIATAPSLPRPEAMIYGLGLAALDIALKLCEDAGYLHPDQHAESLVDDIFHQAMTMFGKTPKAQ